MERNSGKFLKSGSESCDAREARELGEACCGIESSERGAGGAAIGLAGSKRESREGAGVDSLKEQREKSWWNAVANQDAGALVALIEGGFDVDAKGWEGITAAMFAAMKGHGECLALLIEAGCDADAADARGATAALYAVMHGHWECLGMLIAAGCGLESKDGYGTTSAMSASRHGHGECLAMLMSAGCDLDAKDVDGVTPAMWAASHGQCECLGMLMKAGCDLAARDVDGRDALVWASVRGEKLCVAMISAELERRVLETSASDSTGSAARLRI